MGRNRTKQPPSSKTNRRVPYTPKHPSGQLGILWTDASYTDKATGWGAVYRTERQEYEIRGALPGDVGTSAQAEWLGAVVAIGTAFALDSDIQGIVVYVDCVGMMERLRDTIREVWGPAGLLVIVSHASRGYMGKPDKLAKVARMDAEVVRRSA